MQVCLHAGMHSTYRYIGAYACMHESTQTELQTEIRTDRQTARQTYRQTGRQADRRTDGQAHALPCTSEDSRRANAHFSVYRIWSADGPTEMET